MVLMRLRLCIRIILCAWLAMPMSQALAQRPDIGDQPGHIPDAADEDLPAPLRRQLVFYRSTEAPGTIIVHTSEKFLYVVQPNGRAIRYGIGVGREGFQWQGLLHITRKQEWPDWTPPPEMIERQPYLASWPEDPAIPWARGRSISAPRFIAFTAPTSRRPSEPRFRPDASA
jgi:hypothetical protein